MRKVGPSLLLLLPVLLVPFAARAYRTTQDSTSSAAAGMTGRIAWSASPVPYWINEAGSDDLPLAALVPAVETSFATWTTPSCSALVVDDMGTTPTRVAMGDGVDVLAWEETDWSTFGYPSSLIGVTLTEVTRTGPTSWAITGADTHLNGVNYTWVIEGGMPGTTTVDVQSIVTHEAGHYLGLLHPCEVTAFDGAPACGPLLDPGSAPTMYPSYTGETERTLERDDVDGICFLYPRPGCETTRCSAGETCDGAEHCVPTAVDAGAADADGLDASGADGGVIGHGSGCCAIAGTHDGSLSPLFLAGLGALVGCRRRSAREGSEPR